VRRISTLTAAVIVGFIVLVLPAAGCQSCAIDCDDLAPLSRTVDARVVSREDGVVRLVPDEADEFDEFDVEVFGRSSALEIGETYTFPIFERALDEIPVDSLGVDLPSANLPSNCDCGAPYITHTDGAEVDTGILPSIPLRKLGWAMLAASSIAVISWACLRLVGGEPL
jgi:hypothetical protein